jgi:CheY-like chemotaxis protein
MADPGIGRRRRKAVLVVDDDKLIRWAIREALRDEYRVWLAQSAEEARDLLSRLKRLDGILVDIRLPGASGLEFVREARALRPDLRVFVMTGYDPELAPRQAFGVRADGYLPKPFAMETLKDMLASHLVPARV